MPLKPKSKERTSSKPSSGMTYFEDRGTVYRAPIEAVWDFIQKDEEFHPKAHKSTLRNWKDKRLSEVTLLISYEIKEDGKWTRYVARFTEIPPAVRILEQIEGPYAGSTTIHKYTPTGESTVVDVYYFMRSTEFSPAEVKRRALRRSARAYREDLPWFRRFIKKRAAGEAPTV